MIRFLDFETFERNAALDPHWKSYRLRWIYHALAIEMARGLNLKSAQKVLEIGTGGAQIVIGSKTMDAPVGKVPPWGRPAIEHDLKILPWPIKTRRYDLLVALRVWHHLCPLQEACFHEARRVSKFVILCCPEQKDAVGVHITERQFTEWNGGPPLQVEHTNGWGTVYLFGERE